MGCRVFDFSFWFLMGALLGILCGYFTDRLMVKKFSEKYRKPVSRIEPEMASISLAKEAAREFKSENKGDFKNED